MTSRADGHGTLLSTLVRSHQLGAGNDADTAGTASGETPIRIDQTLMQDTTGATVMLALEALELDRARTRVSVQYVDHQIVLGDGSQPAHDLIAQNHRWLESGARRFGLWYSRAGHGISHLVHLERFGVPGETLLGSDSHSCAAGSLGMLGVGAGGLDVALAVAGQPFHLPAARVRGLRLVGHLAPHVAAKDVGLELLRRYGVRGGVGRVFEYHGPGLDALTVMDRFVIAGMGAETGATTSIFPSDDAVRSFLELHGRGQDFTPLAAAPDAVYDEVDEIDLGTIEPLIAMPSSPGNVVPVTEVVGEPVRQVYLGSAGNPGYDDYARAARTVQGEQIAPGVRFDVNLPSARIEAALRSNGLLQAFSDAGATLHPTGCDEFTRDTQAPEPGRLSLRSVNRNFPGRSGTADDRVALVSPETAAASAVTGVITDPRTPGDLLEIPPDPGGGQVDDQLLLPPTPAEIAATAPLVRGDNIVALPRFPALPDAVSLPVLLIVGDDVSTDEILPAGPDVQPYRTNIPCISRFVYRDVDADYADRAAAISDTGHLIVAGTNYGQGSSREHAALAPRYLGLRAVLAVSFARIHLGNLANVGVLPLVFDEPDDRGHIQPGDELSIIGLHALSGQHDRLTVHNVTRDASYGVRHPLSERQLRFALGGGILSISPTDHPQA